MIFLAGSLNMNGGSTFLLRVAKEYKRRGEPLAVVVLSAVVDENIRSELAAVAEVVMLGDLLHPLWRWSGTSQLAVFLPNDRQRLRSLAERNGCAVHAMGSFGLVLAMRWLAMLPGLKVTAGVYHQNEFMFKTFDFFSRQVQRLFAALPASNVVFFNDFTRDSHARFFGPHLSAAQVMPIGIPIPIRPAGGARQYVPGLIVSIGNLVPFKTYNEHMIRIVAGLRPHVPGLRYDIYGTGESEAMLRELAASNGAGDVVRFLGRLPYARFADVVGSACLFVGSGTALIEAAALGVPSMVGIESITVPKTYGLISDVPDLAYNEWIEDRPLVEMDAVVHRLLTAGPAEVARAGEACAGKAQEFSIERTANGLVRLGMAAQEVAERPVVYWMALMLGAIKLALFDRLGLDKTFRDRRNQSTLG